MTKIVVGVDGSESAVGAFRWAVGEARLRGASVSAVTAWSFPALAALPLPAPSLAEFHAMAERTLANSLAGVAAAGVDVNGEVVQGAPAKVLCEVAEGAELLVVGSRGTGGFEGLLLGSVSRAVLHRASCPVAVVQAGQARLGEADLDSAPVIVGIDASGGARHALQVAIDEARWRGVGCVAVHACEVGFAAASPAVVAMLWEVEDAGRRLVNDEVAAVAASDVAVEGRVVVGNAAKTLIDLSGAAALLVVGSHGRGALTGALLGSVSMACAERAHCPVLVVPSG